MIRKFYKSKQHNKMNTLFKIALLATAAQALGLDFETPIADLQLAEKCDPEARKAEACKDLDMDVPGDAEECARREARIDKRMERMAERKAAREKKNVKCMKKDDEAAQ